MRTFKFSIGDIITRGNPPIDLINSGRHNIYLIYDIKYCDITDLYHYYVYCLNNGLYDGYYSQSSETYLRLVA